MIFPRNLFFFFEMKNYKYVIDLSKFKNASVDLFVLRKLKISTLYTKSVFNCFNKDENNKVYRYNMIRQSVYLVYNWLFISYIIYIIYITQILTKYEYLWLLQILSLTLYSHFMVELILMDLLKIPVWICNSI